MVLAGGREVEPRTDSMQRRNRSGRIESRRMARFKERKNKESVKELASVARDAIRGVGGEPGAGSVPDLSGKAVTSQPPATSTFLGQPRPWGGCEW